MMMLTVMDDEGDDDDDDDDDEDEEDGVARMAGGLVNFGCFFELGLTFQVIV